MPDDIDGELPPDPVAPSPAEPRVDTAAVYLAKCLVADHGYVPGTFPEARPLAEASDVVLTGGDGVGLAIACIIDRDRDPERRFTLPPAELDDAAAACRVHAGSVHGMRDSVTVEIWEIGAGVPGDADRARLEGYTFRQITEKGVQVKTYAVDTAPGRVGDLVSTAADGFKREGWIRKVLTQPRRTTAQFAAAVQAQDKVGRFDTRPFATFALLAAFLIMFVVELTVTVMPGDGMSPGIGTLVSLGALEHRRVELGEWWRLITCAFLHGGVMHLLFNGIAMFMAGGVLENLVGRAWMMALFVIGALGGSLASLAINPANIASVGASGAIMGMLAAGIILALRLPSGSARHQIMISLGQILVPSLLPLATVGGDKVDFAAHLGGAVAGAAAGGIILLTWARDTEKPRAGKVAAAIAAAALLYGAYGFIRASGDRELYRRAYVGAALIARNPELVKALVPDDKMPRSVEAMTTDIPALLESHPRDPRVQFIAGALAMDNNQLDVAVTHLDRALAETEIISLLDDPGDFTLRVRWVLAQVHERAGNLPLAHAVVIPSCDLGKRNLDDDIRAYYERMCIAH